MVSDVSVFLPSIAILSNVAASYEIVSEMYTAQNKYEDEEIVAFTDIDIDVESVLTDMDKTVGPSADVSKVVARMRMRSLESCCSLKYIFLLFKRFVHNFRIVMFFRCNDRCGSIFVGDRMLDAGPLYRQRMRSVAAISLRSLERFRAECGNFWLTARVAGRKHANLACAVHQNLEDFVVAC